MINERLIALLKWTALKNPDLEQATGISRYIWKNIRNKPDREIKAAEIEAMVDMYPSTPSGL